MFKRISDLETATYHLDDIGSVLASHSQQLANLECVDDDLSQINEKIKILEENLHTSETSKKQDRIVPRPKEDTLESVRGKLEDAEIEVLKVLGNMKYPNLEYDKFRELMEANLSDNYRVNRSIKLFEKLEIITDYQNSFNDNVGYSLTNFGFNLACYYLDRDKDKPPF